MEVTALVLTAAALALALLAWRAARRERSPGDGLLEERVGKLERRLARVSQAAEPADAFGDEVDVILLELGRNEIQVIKAVREATGLGLKEAKDLVESPAPVVLAERWPRARAESLAALLEEAGATVELT